MHPQIPYAAVLMSIAITLFTLLLFMRAIGRGSFAEPRRAARLFSWIIFPWLLLQAAWGFSGFYRQYQDMPPKLILTGVGPAMLSILALLLVKKWREGLFRLDQEALTWFHIIRVPVEFGLYVLCSYKTVAPEMTFEGRNFDIISGLTAPLVAWLVFKKNIGGRPLLIAWNLLCLVLLANIVVTAVLAAPFPFQEFGFGQPNVAVFYFPFVWLPTVIVPLVLLAHLASLFRLISGKGMKQTDAAG